MSTDQVQREIRQWLDVVRSQLDHINIRLRNDADPLELTADGETAYMFLVHAGNTLERGSMILGEEVRRALDLFMLEGRRAFRRRSIFATDPQPTQIRYQEGADHIVMPSARPHAFPSDGAGSSGPNDPGPQPGPSRNETEGEVNTTYLIWDSRIVDADGDPAEVTIARRWITHQNGQIVWNGFLVDRNGIPVHIPPYIYRGHVRRVSGRGP